MSAFFEILNTFQVITIKLRRFRLQNYFRVLAVKYKQSGLSKNVDTVLVTNSVKYENVITGAIKRNTSDLELRKGGTKVGNKTFVLFVYLKLLLKNKQRFRAFNKLSVIYRFIGFRHETTELCSIN